MKQVVRQKNFFFEKKKQKTFICFASAVQQRTLPTGSNGQRFFGYFFQKITYLSFCYAVCLGLTAAHAQDEPVYHLLGFTLHGTKRVDTDALIATLPQHAGDLITRAQIKEDADRIRAALKARHVHGDMTTALLEEEGKGHHAWVVWDVHLVDALSNVSRRGVRHFAGQTFTGNVKLSAEQLAAATGLHQGDRMPDGRISDARTGIEQSYDAALHGAPVEVKGKVMLKKDDTVVIDWWITEPK
jgi:hypothetical protein